MTTPFQLVIDCQDPKPLVQFWSAALGYVVEPPPDGFDSWYAYWSNMGIPAEELEGLDADESDSIVDPAGVGPRIWFQPVPEPKSVKNRLHLDLKVSGGRSVPIETRRERVTAEVHRLVALGASQLRVLSAEGVDHYAVVMRDPAGNEFCVA